MRYYTPIEKVTREFPCEEGYFFGDNEEFCISMYNGTLVKMLNCVIESWRVTSHRDMIDVTSLDCQKTIIPGLLYNQIQLEIISPKIEFVESKGLLLPKKEFRQATILDLLQMVDKRIKERG